jgi:hypothetical protein
MHAHSFPVRKILVLKTLPSFLPPSPFCKTQENVVAAELQTAGQKSRRRHKKKPSRALKERSKDNSVIAALLRLGPVVLVSTRWMNAVRSESAFQVAGI